VSTWGRFEDGWQSSVDIVGLSHSARCLLAQLWPMAVAKVSDATLPLNGEDDARLEAKYLEPTFLAGRCGMTAEQVGEFMIELIEAGRVLSPVGDGHWTIVGVWKMNRVAVKDRVYRANKAKRAK